MHARVFVMWDVKMCDYYGFSANANAYHGFLMRMQWELREVVIWKQIFELKYQYAVLIHKIL